MTKYREILRLHSMDFSERNIARSCSVSRNTVSKVISAAKDKGISWPFDKDVTDVNLENILFPKTKTAKKRRMPDFDYIRKELLRNGAPFNANGYRNCWSKNGLFVYSLCSGYRDSECQKEFEDYLYRSGYLMDPPWNTHSKTLILPAKISS